MWSTERLRLALALGAVCALAAGCASGPAAPNKELAATPLDQYRAKAVERPEEVALAVHPHGALSPAQVAALDVFARNWREAGGAGAVSVGGPAAGGPDAQLTAQAVADRLVALGVPPQALRMGAYDSGPDAGAPVVARFERLVAEASDCRDGWDNLSSTMSNGVSSHFGCANVHNFAVMLADPRDLRGPRPMTEPDAGRRAAVLDNYRKGAATSSAKDAQASGAISQRVQ